MAEERSLIKRFITQHFLGYSRDYMLTHWEHVVELQSGEIKTLYSTNSRTDDGVTSIGEFTEVLPIIELPQEAPNA